jgi:cell division septation protein DedD
MYNFLFDKKSLVLLLAGATVAGGALFFSGLLVGVQYGLPADPEPVVISRPAAKLAADRPCRPAMVPATPAPVPVTAPAPAPDLRAAAVPQPAPQPAPPPAPVLQPAVSRIPEPVSTEGPARFSLQIGAFREARNSEKAIQELQGKGYEPYVVEQKGRSVLQTVRVGRYADRAEALRAAADFRRREGMEAIVRPLGS